MYKYKTAEPMIMLNRFAHRPILDHCVVIFFLLGNSLGEVK